MLHSQGMGGKHSVEANFYVGCHWKQQAEARGLKGIVNSTTAAAYICKMLVTGVEMQLWRQLPRLARFSWLGHL